MGDGDDIITEGAVLRLNHTLAGACRALVPPCALYVGEAGGPPSPRFSAQQDWDIWGPESDLEAMFTLLVSLDRSRAHGVYWHGRAGPGKVEGVGLDHVHACSQNSESGKFEVVNNNCMFKILEQIATQVCYHVSLTEYCLGCLLPLHS